MFHNKTAFTLVEMLVVVAISAVLSTMVMVYSGNVRDRLAFSIEKSKVVSLVLRARALALSTYGRAAGDTTDTCGYGVSIDYAADTAAIFSYRTTGDPLDPCGRADLFTHNNLDAGRFEVKERQKLFQAVHFDAPSVPDCDRLHEVFFVPPEPRVVFQTGDPAACGANIPGVRIGIRSDQGMAEEISINTFGQVAF